MTGVLVETGQFYSWFVEVNSVVGGLTLWFFVTIAVVDDDAAHLGIFLGPIFAFSFVGILAVLVGGVFRDVGVAEIAEIGGLGVG